MDQNNLDKQTAARIAREEYCVIDEHGRESPAKLAAVLEALDARTSGLVRRSELPDVAGVPRLRGRIENLAQLAVCVEAVLPIVEDDRDLHALSFVNPLRLAVDHLGLAISPTMARYVRRALHGAISFGPAAEPDRVFKGLRRMRWVRAGARKSELTGQRSRRGYGDD
jgi:hypothetical protein